VKKLVIEFLGTFFFILTIALTFDQFAIAAMLMAWVYIGHFVSGGHYNPAVSLAFYLRKKLSLDHLGYYTLAQILGGFAAFAMTAYLHGHVNIPAPGAHVTFLQAFLVEILLTFVFVLLILVVNSSERYKGNDIFGLAIGLVVLALAAIGGPISGGLFNPAISIGAILYGIVTGMTVSWSNLLLYLLGGAIGSVLATYVFHHFIAEDHEQAIIFDIIKK
jgi:aquaporin Z